MEENLNQMPVPEEPEIRLDDESRVKILSPNMMVFKRFIRNRLAIFGLVILVLMFLFSFVGGIISPYRQQEVFRKYEMVPKEYASATSMKAFGTSTSMGRISATPPSHNSYWHAIMTVRHLRLITPSILMK